MTFSFPCPQCGRTQSADWSLAGRKARCTGCGTTMVVPAPSQPTAPAGPENPPSPTLTFDCPQCGRRFSTSKLELAGKKIRCGGCGAGVRVPGLNGTAAPIASSSAPAARPAPAPAPKPKPKPAAPPRAVSAPPMDDLYDLGDDRPSSSSHGSSAESPSDDPYGLDELPALGPRPAGTRGGTSSDAESDSPVPAKKKKKKRKVGLFSGWGEKRKESGGGRGGVAAGGSVAGIVTLAISLLFGAVRYDLFGFRRSEIEAAIAADYKATVDLTAVFRTIVDEPSAHAAVPRATQVINTLIADIRKVEHKKYPQRDIDAVVEKYRERRQAAESDLSSEVSRVIVIPGVAQALMPLQGPFGELAALLGRQGGGGRPFMPAPPMMPQMPFRPPPQMPSMNPPGFPQPNNPPPGFPRRNRQPPGFPGQSGPQPQAF